MLQFDCLSMLPCICTVIDHRWCQNDERTKKWQVKQSQVCCWCSYHTLMSSVIWTNLQQHGNYLLPYIRKNIFLVVLSSTGLFFNRSWVRTNQNVCLTLYTLTSVFIFSTLVSVHLLRCWKGEFVWQAGVSLVHDQFLYSHDINVWFSGDIVRRN